MQSENHIIEVTHKNMVLIPGGEFLMGSDNYYPEEKPVHRVSVDSFYIDRYPVTNEEYEKFVDDTGYITVAERPLHPEDYPGAKPELLVPGALVFRKSNGPVDLKSYFNWWAWVPGANWKHPLGPGSNLKGLSDHPVVHVAYEDAEAYAEWAGKELPSEAEWEFAARADWKEKILHGAMKMCN
jgi:formylglycine-generating enzyme required for sulfatase activity